MALHLEPMKTAEPVVAGEILLIPVADIEIGERLRPIDDVWARALGGVMIQEGQQTPIEVSGTPMIGWELIAGAHRLRAAQLVGMECIEARVVSGSEAHRRMREVSENLWRRELEPIDRAAFVAELVSLHKVRRGINPAKDGRSASVQARWQKAVKDEAADTNVTVTNVYGWAQEVADQLGFSRSKVERDLLLFRRLSPSLVARLRDRRHPISKNAAQLRALAKLEPEQQGRAVELLLADGAVAKSVPDAVRLLAGSNSAADPEAKRLSAFIGAWSRMSIAEKRGAIRELPLPAGFQLLDPARSRDVAETLDLAMSLLVKLCDGEPVEDEEIHEVTGRVQQALMDVPAGVRTSEGDDA